MTDDLLEEYELHGPTREERERRRRLVGAVGISALSLVTLSGLFTGAIFTDQDSTDGQIVAGTVDIAAGGGSVPLNVTNMAPGDTDFGTIVVQNQGSLQLRYTGTGVGSTSTTTGQLADQLQVSLFATANCTAAGVGALTPLSGPQALGTGGGQPVSGPRVLNATAQETLCVRVQLPLNTGNAFQGSSTTLTFTFNAEQTANNP